jgi:riboflavin kinase/FMN adenylyltransferase
MRALAPAYSFSAVESVRLPAKPLHLAIGMFDGVHLGHRAVIEAAVSSARRSGGLAAVLTFRPHPSVLFRPATPTRLILDGPNQARLLAGLGVDALITHPFTGEFATLSAEAFLPWLKRSLPALAAVYVGENWRFGAGRKGDVALLVAEGRKLGLSVYSAPPVSLDGEPVASTRIRALLEAGDVAAANKLLGYSYFAAGRVAPGKRLGRTIGFPTLNLPWAPELRPRYGVYRVQIPGQTGPLPGVANYGVRPTLEQTALPQLETYLLASCPYDAGDPIVVEWLDFLRPEQKFGSLDLLKAQIARDVAAVRAALPGPPAGAGSAGPSHRPAGGAERP